MFRCEQCGRVTNIGEKQNKKVVKTRKKIYYCIDKHGKEIKKEGSEIVKEINICEECFKALKEVGE